MIQSRFVPIEFWPTKKTANRKRSQFTAKYSDTLDLLETELKAIRASNILIQTFIPKSQIRNDGWPKAGANRPVDPGVILTFDRNKKTVSMPCDRYNDWECNLRAIALSLAALRAVDRYGVTQNGEQYKGWEALPSPEKKSDYDSAISLISDLSMTTEDEIANDKDKRDQAIKTAMTKAHPDKGGSHETFVRVSAAVSILRRGR